MTRLKSVAITMDENQKRQRERLVDTKFLLSGILICGQCGAAYCARARTNGKHQYRCIGNDKFRCGEREKCTNVSVYGIELEWMIWLELCKLLQEPNRLRQELENHAKDLVHDQKLNVLKQELKTYRDQLDRLIDAYTLGHIDKAEFENRIGPVRARNERQIAVVASTQKNQHDSTDVAAAQESLSRLGAEVKTQLATADWTLKRSLVKLLIKRIEIHATEIRIVYKVPQVPFFQSPDNRGFVQHWVSCQSAASMTAVFSSLLYRQTSSQAGVLKRAMFATQADMRRRPSESIRWMHHCRRLFSTVAASVVDLRPTIDAN